MRVVYVDYKYHYGNEKLGENGIALNGFVPALEKCTTEVHPFFYDGLISNTERLHSELREFIEKVNPDIVFFVLALNIFKPEFLNSLKKNHITVNFFGDDHWRFESFTRDLASCFTYCVTTDKLSLKKYKAIGIKTVILSQWASTEPVNSFDGDKPDYLYDVLFVGGKNFYREWFVDHLREKGISVDCYGVGWENGPVSTEQMQEIFYRSKINLNIANSSSYDLRFLLRFPVKFIRQLRAGKNASQIKARNFEIPSCYGFQLTDYVPFINEYLEVGKDIICYNQIEEAVDLIQYYLDADDEREAVRKRSGDLVNRKHLYFNRVEEIVKTIKLNNIENES